MLLVGLVAVAAVFLLVKVRSEHSGPSLPIHAEGREQAIARTTLEAAVEELLAGGGRWRSTSGPAAPGRCAGLSAAYEAAVGRAESGAYRSADGLEMRLGSLVYASEAAAERAAAAPTGALVACDGRALAAQLRRDGYAVSRARSLPRRRSSIVLDSRYRGRRYTWYLEQAVARHGRVLIGLATLGLTPGALRAPTAAG